MESILSRGLDVVRAVQTIASPALTAIMKAVTLLGSEWFYLALIPFVFWCISERTGIRLGLTLLFSSFLNLALKVRFAQPRPYDLDPSVGMATDPTHGLPSNHAQGTATFWGMLAPSIRKPWGIVLAVTLPFLVGFSRIYLGVHFPTDVLAGWILGWGIAASYRLAGDRLEELLDKLNVRAKVIAAAVCALAMNAMNMEETGIPGAFFGAAVGAAFLRERDAFRAAEGTLAKKALRCLAGFAGLAAIYFGGKLIAPGEGHDLYALFRFVRYGLVGAWITLGAPVAFGYLGLAGKPAGRKVPAPSVDQDE